MGLWIFLIVAVAFVVWLMRESRKRDEQARQAFLDRIKAAEEWVNSLDELPVVTETRLQLQRGETCHYAAPCEWWEFRKRTKRIDYHGPVASVQLMKGLRYRAGSITPHFERESVLVQIDAGTLYITDKRLFFDGHEKNSTVTWRSVAAVAAFDGGIEIEKQTGRSPFLKLSEQPERAAALATRLLMRAGA